MLFINYINSFWVDYNIISNILDERLVKFENSTEFMLCIFYQYPTIKYDLHRTYLSVDWSNNNSSFNILFNYDDYYLECHIRRYSRFQFLRTYTWEFLHHRNSESYRLMFQKMLILPFNPKIINNNLRQFYTRTKLIWK